MFGIIKKIKGLLILSNRISGIEDDIKNHCEICEKKIQDMAFAYTNDLNDAKSDYLKRYIETRMSCMQNEISSVSSEISRLDQSMLRLKKNK